MRFAFRNSKKYRDGDVLRCAKMKFQIVYDKPGRLRVRAGGFAFDKNKECAIFMVLRNFEGVTSVQVHAENGGILITYQNAIRKKRLEFLENCDTRKLKENL